MKDHKTPPRNGHRRWPWIVAIVLVLLFLGGAAVEGLIPLQRFVPQVEQAVSNATGLPASVGRLEMDFLPFPRIEAHDVQVGEENLTADVGTVTVYPALLPLLSKRLDLTRIQLKGLRLTVPEAMDQLRERIEAIGPKEAAKAAKAPPPFEVTVGKVVLPDISVFAAGKAQALVSGRIVLEDVLGSELTVEADLDVPAAGESASMSAVLAIAPPREGHSLNAAGEITVRNADSRRLPGNASGLPLRVSATAYVKDVTGTSGSIRFDGTVEAAEAPDLAPLAGSFSALAVFDGTAVRLSDVVYESPELQLRAEGSRDAEGAVRAAAASLEAGAGALDAILAQIPQENVQLKADSEARLSAESIEIVRKADGTWDLTKGSATLSGVGAVPPVGEPIEGMGLKVAIEPGNVVSIESLTLPEGEFSGKIGLGPNLKDLAVDLQGRLELTPERTAALIPTSMVREASAIFELERLHVETAPLVWTAKASLSEGKARIEAPGFIDTLESFTVGLEGGNEALKVDGTAVAQKHGPIAFNAAFQMEQRKLEGALMGDLSRVTLPLPPGDAAVSVSKVLDAYGISRIEFTLPVPRPEQKDWSIAVARVGDPGLTVNLAMRRGDDAAWALRTLTASADVAPFAAAGPDGLEASGRVQAEQHAERGALDMAARGVGVSFRGHPLAEGVEGRVEFAVEERRIEGDLRAALLDANMVQPVMSALQGRPAVIPYGEDGAYGTHDTHAAEGEEATAEAQPEPTGGAKAGGSPLPFTGTLDLVLDSLVYRRGTFSKVAARVDLGADLIAVQNLQATPYTGKLAGEVEISRGALPVQCAVDLRLEGIEARIIDDTAFADPRGFHGTLDGVVNVRFPAGGGVEPMKHIDGRMEFVSKKGSFGKIAVISQLLTVLRATEVVYLRLPNLQDRGLAYDRCEGSATFQDGVAAIDRLEAENPTIYLAVDGTIDFPEDSADLKAQVAVLAGVPGLVEKVGLKGVAQGMRDAVSIRARITGSPTSPNVQVTRVGDALKKGAEAIAGTAGKGVKAVGAGAEAVKDLASGLVGGVLPGKKKDGEDKASGKADAPAGEAPDAPAPDD